MKKLFLKVLESLSGNLKGTVGSLLWKWSSWGAMRTYANWLTCGDRHRWRIVHLWHRCLSTVYLFILHNEMKTRVMTDQSPSTYWFICLSIRCNISEDADYVSSKKKKGLSTEACIFKNEAVEMWGAAGYNYRSNQNGLKVCFTQLCHFVFLPRSMLPTYLPTCSLDLTPF